MQLSAQAAAPAAVEPLESVVVTQVDGWIVVSPAGEVTDFQTDATLVPGLRENLQRTVLSWRAQPILIDGKAHQFRAKTRVVLAATKMGEKYSVKVDNVTFPNDSAAVAAPIDGSPPQITGNKFQPPIYPADLLRARVSGRALLCILVGADGRAEKVMAVQTMLYDAKGRDRNLRMAIDLMEKSAVSTAQRWRFNISAERARLAPQERTVRVPVDYLFDRTPAAAKPGMWRAIVRVPMRKVEWVPESADSRRIGVADVVADEVMPASSLVKLDTDVAGMIVM